MKRIGRKSFEEALGHYRRRLENYYAIAETRNADSQFLNSELGGPHPADRDSFVRRLQNLDRGYQFPPDRRGHLQSAPTAFQVRRTRPTGEMASLGPGCKVALCERGSTGGRESLDTCNAPGNEVASFAPAVKVFNHLRFSGPIWKLIDNSLKPQS